MTDLIDRQAAIEIIQSMYPGMPRIPWMRKDWQKRYEPYIRTENAIRELPSVQPEIIRCKDCKYNYGFTHGGEFNPDDIVCTFFDTDGMQYCDFCSYAERRTDERPN